MRVKWTRDEVILALDILFTVQRKTLSMDNPAIIELSELLNRLPIVSNKKRPDTFRNIAGVSRQLSSFDWGIKNFQEAHVGNIFYEMYNEFKENKEVLHNIAQAIRRCVELVQDICFADESEMEGFREGALLAHLHRYLEKQYGDMHSDNTVKCNVCGINPQHIYDNAGTADFLQPHLLIPPEQYGPDTKPSKKDFITVCPNCHTMLHQTRPWMNADNVNKILKTL